MDLAPTSKPTRLSSRIKTSRGRINKRAPRAGIFLAEDINGFAVADKDGGAVIGVSQAAVDQLSEGQLDALLSHELGHIVTGDMARMMFHAASRAHWSGGCCSRP